MSIIIMFKKCTFCGRKFTYNPSVGDFGLFCPHCKKPQLHRPHNRRPNKP